MYGVPLHEGVPIQNLHAAAHIKNSRVFFYSAIIGIKKKLTKRSSTTSKSRAVKSSKEAVDAAVECLGVPFYRDIAPVMESHWTRDGSIIPVWKFQLRNTPMTRWLQVRVNANTGGIVSMEDFKMGFTYTAIKLPNKSPEDRTATKGVFGRGFDPISPPETPKNLVASAANAFYVTNTFHDTLYQYGFTESAGNFQEKNFGKGGKEGDSISIDIQSSDETDNAAFYTPPDGQYGVLYLHRYTATKPNRDSALDNTMLAHELAHGLSGRLTGGAT
ncbi:hypothetical protein BASA83_009639 [Batrachochytrium salamandrivorans]|nr:hypothetical protein BASA83_009639 [Batrachochytrium salamandrivorans]